MVKELKRIRRVYTRRHNGQLFKQVDEFDVTVMARADGYAMVRKPGRMPFVVKTSELLEIVNEPKV